MFASGTTSPIIAANSLGRVNVSDSPTAPAVEVDVGERYPRVLACFFHEPDGATMEFIERRRDAAP